MTTTANAATKAATAKSAAAKPPATMPGAELLLRALVDQGVDVVFGYPGGAVLPIYDA